MYAATSPLRVVTTPSLDTATSAWKNMVARTRFAFSKYIDPADYRKALHHGNQPDALAPSTKRVIITKQNVLTKGALYFFFLQLSEIIAQEAADGKIPADHPRCE